MPSKRQRAAARRNVKVAQKAARKKKTISKLPARVRRDLVGRERRGPVGTVRKAVHLRNGAAHNSMSGPASWASQAGRPWERAN
jgi:hypothetical protein